MGKEVSVTQLFAKMPKAFYGDTYKGLSWDAKALYTASLDRLQLSKLNHIQNGGWFDYTQKKTFIFYSIEHVMLDICCAKQKAIKIRKELVQYGLWQMIDQGANKATKIFVHEIIPSQQSNKLRYNQKVKKGVKERLAITGREVKGTTSVNVIDNIHDKELRKDDLDEFSFKYF